MSLHPGSLEALRVARPEARINQDAIVLVFFAASSIPRPVFLNLRAAHFAMKAR